MGQGFAMIMIMYGGLYTITHQSPLKILRVLIGNLNLPSFKLLNFIFFFFYFTFLKILSNIIHLHANQGSNLATLPFSEGL